MPEKHGKEACIKIKEFLSNADAQKAFLENMPKKRKRAEVETSEAVPEESEANAVAPAKRRQSASQLNWRYGRRFYWMKSSPDAMEDQSRSH